MAAAQTLVHCHSGCTLAPRLRSDLVQNDHRFADGDEEVQAATSALPVNSSNIESALKA